MPPQSPVDSDPDDTAQFFYTLHGRILPALNTTYLLPVDPDEVKVFPLLHVSSALRSDIHHRLIQFLFDGKNYVGPVHKAMQFGEQRRVLDLGTGSGAWAIDIADEFPRAEVLAVDLAPIQPRHVPPNCTFELCDIAQWPLPFPDAYFDFIHARSLNIGMQDYPRFLLEVSRLLRPGGLLLLIEPTLFPCPPPSQNPPPPNPIPNSNPTSIPNPNTHPHHPHSNPTSTLHPPPPSHPGPAPHTPTTSSALRFSSTTSNTPSTPSFSSSLSGVASGSGSVLTHARSNSQAQSSRSTSSASAFASSSSSSQLRSAAANPGAGAGVGVGAGTAMPPPPVGVHPHPPHSPAHAYQEMPGWAALWRTFRACLRTQRIDVDVPEKLANLLAGANGAFENIMVHDGTVPVGFWPSDPHLLSAGQLQWMDYELLLPALRPLFLKHGLAPTNVDRLIQEAQRDLYWPMYPPSTRIHVAYANKRYTQKART